MKPLLEGYKIPCGHRKWKHLRCPHGMAICQAKEKRDDAPIPVLGKCRTAIVVLPLTPLKNFMIRKMADMLENPHNFC